MEGMEGWRYANQIDCMGNNLVLDGGEGGESDEKRMGSSENGRTRKD
jgi:hypothetical protein